MTIQISPEAEAREELRLKRAGEKLVAELEKEHSLPVHRNHEIKCPDTVSRFDGSGAARELLDSLAGEVEAWQSALTGEGGDDAE